MPDTPRTPPPACWPHACALVACFLALALFATPLLTAQATRLGIGAREAGQRVTLCLLTLEAAFLAVGVPFLVVASLRLGSRRGRLVAVGAPVLAMAAIGLAACSLGAGGAVSGGRLVWCQVFLTSFAAVVAAATTLARSLGMRPTTSQLAATLVALAMVGNVFLANPLVEGVTSQGARTRAIQAVLWTNPWLTAGGTILEADPIRAKRLYSWSVISYYSFHYPASGLGLTAKAVAITAAYTAAALAAALLARLLVWFRQRRLRHGAG